MCIYIRITGEGGRIKWIDSIARLTIFLTCFLAFKEQHTKTETQIKINK